MALSLIHSLLPDRPVPTRIWRGPFRGARIVMNPRHSLRKILGLYEHELNPWLETALSRVEQVIDVGANDGYFTFGCMAALRRQGRAARILAFEPEERPARELRQSLAQRENNAHVDIIQCFVGAAVQSGFTTLDALGPEWPRRNTLIKIDVEGAEPEVVNGAQTWLHSSHAFVIEVHHRSLLDPLRKTFSERGLAPGTDRPAPVAAAGPRKPVRGKLVAGVGAVAGPAVKWICCQLGAREHYAIPRALHRAGSLEGLVTDTWVAPGNLLGTARPALRQRFHSELRDARVLFSNVGSISFELRA